jgi:hypothetical protein
MCKGLVQLLLRAVISPNACEQKKNADACYDTCQIRSMCKGLVQLLLRTVISPNACTQKECRCVLRHVSDRERVEVAVGLHTKTRNACSILTWCSKTPHNTHLGLCSCSAGASQKP